MVCALGLHHRERRVLERIYDWNLLRLGLRPVPWALAALEQSPLLRYRLEKIGMPAHRFRSAEKQEPPFPECEVKQRNDPLLDREFEVNEQIAAADEIQAGKRWIADQVLRGEHHCVADFPANLIMPVQGDEETVEPLRGDVCGNALRINTVSGPG